MANQMVVSVDRYDLKFNLYRSKQQSVAMKSSVQNEVIAKSIASVLIKMFEDQKN